MYKAEPEKARKEKRLIAPNLNVLGSLDQMVQKLLVALRSRGLITSVIAAYVAKALIARNLHLMLDHIDLDASPWAKSLFCRMGCNKCMKTAGKIEIPDGAKKEAQLLYLHDIVSLVRP